MRPLPESDNIKSSEIARAVNEIIRLLGHIDPTMDERVGQVEPESRYLRGGKQAWADGINWDPGSGEGLYLRTAAGAWVKL